MASLFINANKLISGKIRYVPEAFTSEGFVRVTWEKASLKAGRRS
jgi:hypothetical protein